MFRALALSLGTIILNLALNVTLAKYGATAPDWLIVCLWLLPLLPLLYWAITHEKLLRHRTWVVEQYRHSKGRVIGVATIAVVLIGASLFGAGYRILKRITRVSAPQQQQHSQNNPTAEPKPSPQSTTPIVVQLSKPRKPRIDGPPS